MASGLAQKARDVAAAGRYGDTELLHLNKAELAGIASVVPLTKNPETGYHEAFLPLLLGLGGTLLGSSGALAGTALAGASPALLGALGSGLGTTIETGDIGQGLMAGLTGYGIGSLMGGALGGGAASDAAARTAAAGANAAPTSMAAPAGLGPAGFGASAPMGAPSGFGATGVPQNLGLGPAGFGGPPPAFGLQPGNLPPMTAQNIADPAMLSAPPLGGSLPPSAAAGPLAGNAGSSDGGGIAGLMSKKNMPLIAGGLGALSAFMPGGGTGVGPKGSSYEYNPLSLSRERLEPGIDREGREGRHFTESRYIPKYSDGGVVRSGMPPHGEAEGYFLGGLLDAATAPLMAPIDSIKNLAKGNFKEALTGPLAAANDHAAYPWQILGYDMKDLRNSLPFGSAKAIYDKKDLERSQPTPGWETRANERGWQRKNYAGGGVVRYAEGGIASMAQQGGGGDDVVIEAVKAIRGQSQNPRAAIEAFIRKFGAAAFEALMQREMAGGGGGQRSDGMSDGIAAINPDGRPAALSEGEYVVPSDVVSGLGNGSTDAGARSLEDMVGRVREQRNGTVNTPDQIDPELAVPM